MEDLDDADDALVFDELLGGAEALVRSVVGVEVGGEELEVVVEAEPGTHWE